MPDPATRRLLASGLTFLLARRHPKTLGILMALAVLLVSPSLHPVPAHADALGSVWYISENGGGCNGVLTRSGSSSTFYGTWSGNCRLTATANIQISGNQVFIHRYSSSDGNDCDYQGSVSSDYSAASGTYHCTHVQPPPPGSWTATIQGASVSRPPAPSAPPPPSNPPDPPANFRITSVSSSSITVAWDDTPLGALNHTVSIYSPYTCGCYNDAPRSSDNTSYTFSNLTPGSWYCFIAYAWNDDGYSGWTQWACSYAR